MEARQITTEYRTRKWIQLFKERNQTGETVKVFCETRGISRDAYYYWQHKLRCMSANQLPQADNTPAVPAGWVVCRAVGSPAADKGIAVEIGGCRVTVAAGTDMELLARVCRVLLAL